MKKTIVFGLPSLLPTMKDAIEYLIPYSLVDSSLIGSPEENSKTSRFSIKVGASGTLKAGWNLNDTTLIKVLFEYGKRHIIQKLKDGALSESEELLLTSHNAEIPCIFDPRRISEPNGAKEEIDFKDAQIMQNPNFLQLASSIIDIRDNINAVFFNVHKEKLILVREERDLLQFFRDATTTEEFFFRLCALANASTALNVPTLRNITCISDKQIKSISLLEKYLENIGVSSSEIIKILRSINRMRQGYPVHGDQVEGMLEAHEYFNFKYPVTDFSNTWRTLLSNYLNALQILFEGIKEKA